MTHETDRALFPRPMKSAVKIVADNRAGAAAPRASLPAARVGEELALPALRGGAQAGRLDRKSVV
jgi:hypothetical protein